MGRYPRAVRWLLRLVDSVHRGLPFLAPRKLRWSPREKALDELYRAGSLCFCVVKSQEGCGRVPEAAADRAYGTARRQVRLAGS